MTLKCGHHEANRDIRLLHRTGVYLYRTCPKCCLIDKQFWIWFRVKKWIHSLFTVEVR